MSGGGKLSIRLWAELSSNNVKQELHHIIGNCHSGSMYWNTGDSRLTTVTLTSCRSLALPGLPVHKQGIAWITDPSVFVSGRLVYCHSHNINNKP